MQDDDHKNHPSYIEAKRLFYKRRREAAKKKAAWVAARKMEGWDDDDYRIHASYMEASHIYEQKRREIAKKKAAWVAAREQQEARAKKAVHAMEVMLVLCLIAVAVWWCLK